MMNSKAFRRNHGPKPKSASSTFISLHFNKSDEDQLEISYKNDKRELEEVSQSNQSDIFPPKSSCLSTKSTSRSYMQSYETAMKNSQHDFEVKSANLQPEKRRDFQLSDDELKLSPAIEAAELIDSSNFNHYISRELEEAKCEILEEVPQSGKHIKNELFHLDLKMPKSSDCHKTDKELSIKGSSYFYSIFQNSFIIMKYAQNSTKFHILIAMLACVCAPIPSWLSGFLVGTILSSSLVYWLHKPPKNRKKISSFNFVPPVIAHTSDFEKESGILKGWMNELPPLMSYSPERYHVTCTRSVYVRLEGSYLRFSFPQKNIPKRAMFSEPRYEMQFTYQQHYDITNATVELLPRGLSNKRLWSKKYPICLRIPNCKGAVLLQGKSAEGVFSPAKRKLMIRTNENNEIVIYLFSRTDRDKNLWFVRFMKASKMKIRSHSPTLSRRIAENKRTMSVDFACLQDSDDEVDDSSFVKLSLSKAEKFEMYMSALLYREYPFATKKDKDSALTWFNVLIGRLFFDFLVEDVWAQLVSQKIQKKLNRIKLPFFLAELTVKDIHLGSALPKVHHASDPCIDEQGLWIDMDVSYNGSFHMTLETKLNLDRFKSETLFSNEEQTKATLCDSDEDSVESSSDDECFSLETDEDCSHKEGSLPVSSTGSTSKKFFKLMDKLAQSSYFQHATKNKYVKRAMNDISNTPLVLTVQVEWLTGTLAVNIPPWPTDRLWYGFRNNPSLSVTARPKLGQHVVTLTQITEWIEKKLTSEFQKVLVMPNMDDLIIPIMQPAQDVS